jgi:hypothetical protein
MKDYLLRLVAHTDRQLLARCIIREYLQARILQSLQEHGVFETWVFQGGTALRFLYSMPRFSEDLDFAFVKPSIGSNFSSAVESAVNTFHGEGYDLTVKLKGTKTVQSAFIGFTGLLFEAGLSPHRSEKLSIKVEVDTNPPHGAKITSTVVRRHVTLNLRHYDKASLLAGKLHAILTRRYIKGRDCYDLMWYLADRSWPEPNLEWLNNALTQTGWQGPVVKTDNWRTLVRSRVESFVWKRVADDVGPFLERAEEVRLLSKDNILSLLTGG